MNNSCSSCAYSISNIPGGDLCVEGLNPLHNTHDDCKYYAKDILVKLPNGIKDLIHNPYNYWHLIPRYVRGVLSHKFLVLSDRGLAIFHSPKWLIHNVEDLCPTPCPILLRHLRRYMMSFSSKKVNDLYIYLLIENGDSLYVISSNKPLDKKEGLNWEYSNNAFYADCRRQSKYVLIWSNEDQMYIYLPRVISVIRGAFLWFSLTTKTNQTIN